jgi:hypothetical protein
MVDADGVLQAIDLERTSKCAGQLPPRLFFQYYAASIASNDKDSIEILMSQVKFSGLDATHKHFSDYFVRRDFLQTAFNHDAFDMSPATAFPFVGFWHLMELLHEKAACKGDTIPRLAILDGNTCISCHIRPHFIRGTVVPCNIYFNISATGSIIICSAEFRDQNKDVTTTLRNCFQQHSRYFNLKDQEDAKKFFDFALSFEALYSSDEECSDDETRCDKKPNASKKHKPQNEDPIVSGDSERNRALNKQFRFLAAKKIPNDVWQNCVSSILQQFPDYNPPPTPSQNANKLTSSHTQIVLNVRHVECDVVIVSDCQTEQQCLAFIANHNVLTLDTETAYPRFPEQGAKISLIQLGTNQKVFIIQVSKVTIRFLSSLKAALESGNLVLVHWGGSDRTAIETTLGGKCSANWVDLQAKMSLGRSNLLGLDAAMQEYLQKMYSLSKDWTLSGWDLDILDPKQSTYAALDVCACHILYLHHELCLDIFQTAHSKFHSFFTPVVDAKGAKLVKHGISFEQNCCCHYAGGDLIRGLFAEMSSNVCIRVIPQGFQPIGWHEDDISHIVPRFVDMLNVKKFCCSTCSGLNWFQTIDFSSPHFKVVPNDLSIFSYSRSKVCHDVEVQVPSGIGSHHLIPEAYFCLSMLSSFLSIKLGAIDGDRLVKSVICDCRHGFIRNTLFFLQNE